MKERKLDRNVVALGLTSFFNDWSSEMILPLLPAFMAEILGIPKTLIGLIEGVSQSLASVLKVFSGYISDRVGRRKWLAITGYVLSNAVKPLLAVANGWAAVLSVRAADRIGKGIRTAPRDALIASSGSSKGRGRSFGFHRMMDTSGAILGTITAFLLMRFLAMEEAHRYRLIFLLAVIPGIVGVLCIIFGARERAAAKAAEIRLSWNVLPANLKRVVIASVIFGVGNFTFTFFLLRVRDMGVSAMAIPLAYLLHNIVYAGASYPAGILADRWGKKNVLGLGILVYVATALGFAAFNAPAMAWVLMAVFGLHMALSDATARALVSDLAPDEVRGTALGVYHTGVGVADLPAGLLAGVLWDAVSPQAVFLTGAVLALVSFAILMTVRTNGSSSNSVGRR